MQNKREAPKYTKVVRGIDCQFQLYFLIKIAINGMSKSDDQALVNSHTKGSHTWKLISLLREDCIICVVALIFWSTTLSYLVLIEENSRKFSLQINS